MNGDWFADVDPEAAPAELFQWQPRFQVADEAMCFSFDVWFRTKEECEGFIRKTLGVEPT